MGSEKEDTDREGVGEVGGSDKFSSEITNTKMYSDPGTELFSSSLMPTATLISSPKAA